MIELLSAIARRHSWARQDQDGWNKKPRRAVVLPGLLGLQERGYHRPASAGAVVLPGMIDLLQERGYQVTGTDQVEARRHSWARQDQE